MRTFSILLGLALMAFCAGASASTIFTEDFNYSTGMLSTVSGGVWSPWGGTSTDAVVLSKMAAFDGIGSPDVVTYYSDAIPGAGKMTYSFDFFVHEEDLDDFEAQYVIGSGDPVTKAIDYSTGFALAIDWNPSPGTTTVHIWDLDFTDGGGNFGYNAVVATGLSVDAWHNLTFEAVMTVPDRLGNPAADADGQFRILVDNALAFDWTNFGNNSLAGLNATEIAVFGNSQEHDVMYFDKINVEFTETIIPEPGMFALAGLGLLMLIRRRK